MRFGSRLAEWRGKADITQRKLALRCGLSPAYVANLERDNAEPPPPKTCKALARALGVDFGEVWGAAFTARLRRWLKREGYSGLPEEAILDLVKRIDAASR